MDVNADYVIDKLENRAVDLAQKDEDTAVLLMVASDTIKLMKPKKKKSSWMKGFVLTRTPDADKVRIERIQVIKEHQAKMRKWMRVSD